MVDVAPHLAGGSEWLDKEFSFSKLFCYSRCPTKARKRYLEGLRDDTPYMVFGKAIHHGLEVDNLAKVEGRYLPIQELLDVAVGKLKEEASKYGMGLDVDTFAEEHGAQLVAYEEKRIRQSVRPVPGSIEAPFEIDLEFTDQEPAKLKGFVDLVNSIPESNSQEVIDYKSGSRPTYQKGAETSLQCALYTLGAQCGRHRIISWIRGGRQAPTVRITEPVLVNDALMGRLLSWLEATITAWRKSLKTGLWPRCAPDAFYCSSTACAYFEDCYPRQRPLVPRLKVGSIKTVGTLEKPAWRK